MIQGKKDIKLFKFDFFHLKNSHFMIDIKEKTTGLSNKTRNSFEYSSSDENRTFIPKKTVKYFILNPHFHCLKKME